MSDPDEYDPNEAANRFYNHNQFMDVMQNKISSIAALVQPPEQTELISKIVTDNREFKDKFNQISNVEHENERLRAKIAELESKIENTASNVNTGFTNFNTQLVNFNNKITPVYDHYQTDKHGQIDVVSVFLKLHYKKVLGAKTPAKEINGLLYAFSVDRGIPIKKTEAKALLTGPPFNLEQYKSTGGIACYRDLEAIPIDLSSLSIPTHILPQIRSSSINDASGNTSPRSIPTGASSPSPIILNRK